MIENTGGVSMAKSISGIYAIVNRVNGKRYIGSAVDISQRWRQHTYKLRKNEHPSKHLQSAWNLYGKENFNFIVLEIVSDPRSLTSIEQVYLDAEFPEYNTNRIAGNMLGFRFSEEAKNIMSIIHTGFRHTEESKKKMSEYWAGRPRGKYSDERVKHMSESRKGKKPNAAQLDALSIGRGAKSEETKRKISESQKGYIPTEKTIEKLKQAWIRRKARKCAK
jgi:group I intron endonuclease